MKTYRVPHVKTRKILAYRYANPNDSIWDVAHNCNATYKSAYNALYQYDAFSGDFTHLKPLIAGYEWKPPIIPQLSKQISIDLPKPEEPKEPPMAQEPEFKQEVEDLLDGIELEDTEKESEIYVLKHDKIILEAVVKAHTQQLQKLRGVIEYLEEKLGIDEIDARLEATRD
jgi:hypothetical protein